MRRADFRMTEAAQRRWRARADARASICTSHLRDAFLQGGGHGKQGQEATHLEHFAHHVLQADEHHLSLAGTQLLAGHQHHAQACGADVVERGEVQHQALHTRIQTLGDEALHLGRAAAVQSAAGAHDQQVFAAFLFNAHVVNPLEMVCTLLANQRVDELYEACVRKARGSCAMTGHHWRREWHS
ncbi:hypothetical protein SDC9_63696 [bioreactor metagenome]|uniref:Uncharacterized protein n=1 Tax=bioreactor metagenome TaxID=1076179 RepID=A0A644XNG4_9ZZZZ